MFALTVFLSHSAGVSCTGISQFLQSATVSQPVQFIAHARKIRHRQQLPNSDCARV
jgi:hypothetical protein